jgi:hypothetical protein
MNVKNILLFLVFMILFLSECSTSSTKSSNDTTLVNFTFKRGKPLPANEWHCYNVRDEKICIPSSWRFVNQNLYLFVANPTVPPSNSYFVVLKYTKSKSGYDAVKYLKELSSEEKKDTASKFIDQKISKTVYSDKIAFYSESHSLIGNVLFTTYSTVFEIGNDLFDITLKTKSSQQKTYQETYKDILFNFYNKDQLVFSINDKVESIENIDIGKI